MKIKAGKKYPAGEDLPVFAKLHPKRLAVDSQYLGGAGLVVSRMSQHAQYVVFFDFSQGLEHLSGWRKFVL